jgi:hypothetical protein
MRLVLRYMDHVVAPSLAMIAASRLAAPGFAGENPEGLRRKLARIPLLERRATWEKLMFQTTPAHEIAESQRRVSDAIRRFEGMLSRQPWFAGDSFSLADIGVFASFYALPLSMTEEVNDAITPRLMRWQRACHARPALQAALAMGKGYVTERACEVRECLGLAA